MSEENSLLRYCTSCGAERAGSPRFCTQCGTAFAASVGTRASAAPAAPPIPSASSWPPRATSRQLRCVRCGSSIDQGLTCAACSREDTKVPISEPATAAPPIGGTPATPTATTAPPTPAPFGAAPPRPISLKAEPAPSNQAVSSPRADATKGRRIAGALGGLLVALAAGFGHWANQHPGTFAHVLYVSPFGGGLDGVYDGTIYDAECVLTVAGSSVTLSVPGAFELRDSTLERHGNTLKLTGGVAYDAHGYLLDATEDPRADLATVGDDGQSITIHLGKEGDVKFVRR